MKQWILAGLIGFSGILDVPVQVGFSGQDEKSDALPAPVPAPIPAPLPQRPVNGVRGVLVTSLLEFEDPTAAPLELDFLHVFPDRTRLKFELPENGLRSARRILRSGAKVWEMQAPVPTSRLLEGQELERNLLSLELRRALFLWPAGLEWEFAEDGATAEVTLQQAMNHPVPLGALIADLDPEGRPNRIAAVNSVGAEWQAIQVQSWDDQHHPSSMTIEQEGKLLGRERVLVWRSDIYYHDEYFVPPDRRPKRPGKGRRLWQSMDLVPACLKRLPLPAGCTWAKARTQREAWAQAERESLSAAKLGLDPRPSFEIDWTGQPVAVLLRLNSIPTEAPKGWATKPGRPGVGLVLLRLDQLDEPHLSTLRRGIPESASAGKPYVLLPLEGPFEAQVFVSFAGSKK